MDFLIEKGCPYGSSILEAFVRQGKLKFLRKHYRPTEHSIYLRKLFHVASEKKNFKIAKWISEQDQNFFSSPETFTSAPKNPEILKLLEDNGVSFTCDQAAASNHLKLLRRLRSEGHPWSTHTLRLTSSKAIIYWAVSNGCPVGNFFFFKSRAIFFFMPRSFFFKPMYPLFHIFDSSPDSHSLDHAMKLGGPELAEHMKTKGNWTKTQK